MMRRLSWSHLQHRNRQHVVDPKDPMLWTVMTRCRDLHSNKMFDVTSVGYKVVCYFNTVAHAPTPDHETASVGATAARWLDGQQARLLR
jgi:hypothetical protein